MRDIEYGMVSIYEFDDIEYRSFDGTRGVVGHSDGSGDTSVEGVEPFLRWVGREGGRVHWRVYSSASMAERL